MLALSDGTTMAAYVARPAGEVRAGLMVFQEAFGVNAHIRDIVDRLAAEGYLAIAPELFHRTGEHLEIAYDNYPATAPHMSALTAEGLLADARAAFDWLQSQGVKSTGAIGFCMGGRTAFLANSALPLSASVSFYGGNIAPSLLDRIPNLHAPQLFFWGELDDHIPRAQRLQVTGDMQRQSKHFVNVEFSNAGHGFFCDARASYQPEAARQAWALTKDFLTTHLLCPSKK